MVCLVEADKRLKDATKFPLRCLVLHPRFWMVNDLGDKQILGDRQIVLSPRLHTSENNVLPAGSTYLLIFSHDPIAVDDEETWFWYE